MYDVTKVTDNYGDYEGHDWWVEGELHITGKVDIADTAPLMTGLTSSSSAADIVAALQKNKWPDYVVMFIAILGTTLPVFVLISLTQWIFGVKLQWLPPSGWGKVRHMILPIAVSAFGSVATYARYVKASMLDTLDQDYVLTARAKGLSEFQIITRHVLRNSLMPAITIFAGSVVGVFTGAFVTERMFAIPGIGFYYISSINNYDYTMILGTTVFYAILFVVMQLFLDIIYTLIDPRIRVGGGKK